MPAKKILVVDDDRSIIKFVKAHLDANGFKVLTARDGDEALKVIEGEYPDLKYAFVRKRLNQYYM